MNGRSTRLPMLIALVVATWIGIWTVIAFVLPAFIREHVFISMFGSTGFFLSGLAVVVLVFILIDTDDHEE